MSKFTTYVKFVTGVGFVGPLQLVSATPGDYVAWYSVDNEILLHLGYGKHGEVSVSSSIGGTWSRLMRLFLPALIDRMSVHVEPIDARLVRISFDSGESVQVVTPIPLARARAVRGIGDWTVTETVAAPGAVRDLRRPIGDLDEAPLTQALPSDDLVFDIGMHNGSDTEFYLRKGFRVVAVEANPVLAEASARRFKQWMAIGRLVILNLGIAEQAGAVPFFVNNTHSEWSSFDRDIASRGHAVEEIIVNAVPADRLFSVFGVPHYVKADIEEYDHCVIEAISRLGRRPRYVSFENGYLPVFELLVCSGYDAFKLVSQSRLPELKSALPGPDGSVVEYRFPFGSSGPFGEETPGDWLPAADMRQLLEDHFAMRSALSGPDVEWWDLHARLTQG